MASADRLIEVFHEAKARPAGAERNAFLAETCRDQPALKEQVLSLLQAHDGAGDFLKNPIPSPTVVFTEKPGDRIGRYKLLQQIGEGGCGVVYMAEQEEPVRRRVALKVIKLGMDTKSVVARFEAERQALALMDHPNIAKVFDAGATDAGRPYFVMELVRGVRITDYCDENKLSTEDRLKLFTQVCAAIQHAHQKGIIHRDIKPSNILVTVSEPGSAGCPKVIDFGIAKATNDQRLTDKTVFTAFEQFIGTPAYMSPEQAMMTSLDIDTRTDIYALGVLLYELLTGRTPFDAEELMASGLDAMRRIIREREPVSPSTRLSTMMGADLNSVASHRQAEPGRLGTLLRGDVDWIVMKCLEKDRTRRYETANGLAMDIQRHLNDEPIVASPPGAAYRFQKLVRRNKLAFAASGAVFVALVLGVVASTLQAVRATRAEHEQSRLRSLAEASQKKSETEAAKAIAISEFLQQMLGSANPEALKGPDYSVRQLLDDFSAGLTNQLKDQPEVEATVRATIGRAYDRLGVPDQAQPHQERVLTLRRRVFGGQAEPVAESLVDYAWTCVEQGHYAQGEPLAREALDIYRKRGSVGRPVLAALAVLHRILIAQGRFEEVDAVTEEATTLAGKSPGVEFPEIATMTHGLADVRNKQSRFVEAESLARKAVEMHRRLHGAEHPETAWALVSLGAALRGHQKLDDAETVLEEALRIFQKYYLFGHKSLDVTRIELRLVLEAKGDFAGIEALSRQRLAEADRRIERNDGDAAAWIERAIAHLRLGMPEMAAEDSAKAATRSANDGELKLRVADLFLRQRKPAEAEILYREILAAQRISLTNDSQPLANTLCNLAAILQAQDKQSEAEKMLGEALEITLKQRDQNLASLPSLLRGPAQVLKSLGRALAVNRIYDQSIPVTREALGESHPVLGELLHDYAVFLEREGWWEPSAVQFIKSLPIRRANQNEPLAWTLRSLGGVLIQAKRPAEAEPYLRESLSLFRKLYHDENVYGTAWAGERLGYALYQQNKLPEAERAYRDALVAYAKTQGSGGAGYKLVIESLSRLLKSQGRQAEVEALHREVLAARREIPDARKAATPQPQQNERR